ncbi:MAG TPA: ATP-binding protein, partial [Candidatus Limnocylindrales bacterium]|nr:ATP-binding protein [Candidatus Limnocylindrales bacterium]
DAYVASQRVPFESARTSFVGHDDHVILELPEQGFGDRSLIEEEGLARVLANPLTRDGEFIGSLNAYMKRRDAEFHRQSIDLAHVLAVEASVAITNAQMYEQVVHQRDLQEGIFAALGEGIIIMYPPDRVGAMNDVAAEFVGNDFAATSIGDVMTRTVPRDAATGEPLDASNTPAARALRGEDVHVELIYKNVVTGVERFADVKARPVRSGGEIVAAVVTMYDLTDLRRMEQEKEQFLSIVSHELRTPLTPLKALAQLLISRIRRTREKGTPLDMDSLERNLASIERQVDRMNGLVTDLLSVSRAGRGKLEMDARPFDLATSVRDTVERYVEATREEGRHSFVVEAPPQLVLSADQSRIEQLLMNLIGNVVKYSPRGGQVRVELRRENGEAEIVIKDEGIGIVQEDLERLGEPFTRGTGKAASFAGMGIGLHVAKLMAEAHGGSLGLESEGEDRGTTVRVKLPA